MHPSRRDILIGCLLALFSTLIWSGWVVLSRFGVTHTFSAADITAIRFGAAGLLMFPLWVREVRHYSMIRHFKGITVAFLIGAPYTLLAVQGMAFSSVVHAGIINAMSVATTFLFSFLWLNNAPKSMQWVGVFANLCGVGILILAKDHVAHAANPVLGCALFAMAGFIWGLNIGCTKKWALSAMGATANVCVWSMLLYLPIYFYLCPPQSISLASLWGPLGFQLFYQGFLTSIVAFFAFTQVIHKLGATAASAFIPLVPLFATLAAMWWLNEIPTALEWLGLGLIFVGILLTTGILKGKRAVERYARI